MGKPRVAPIGEVDANRVATFLNVQLNTQISAESWARALRVPWEVDAPNHGFMLTDGEEVVGVYLAFYSVRVLDGRPERFCNLGAWCVLPGYRLHSLRLLNALLAQRGYHFTDLSPSGNTVPVNTRMKFQFFDTTTALTPNLPWPSHRKGDVVTADREEIERRLSGRDLDIYRDHASTAAAHHLLLMRGEESCYLIFRKDRRKKLRIFASVLYVSNPTLFNEMMRAVSWYLLRRHGVLATLTELRIVAHRPRLSLIVATPRPKMFRSEYLAARQFDDLYSELVCLNW
jgi:hypothetical protein